MTGTGIVSGVRSGRLLCRIVCFRVKSSLLLLLHTEIWRSRGEFESRLVLHHLESRESLFYSITGF